jgi:hypothetical protein
MNVRIERRVPVHLHEHPDTRKQDRRGNKRQSTVEAVEPARSCGADGEGQRAGGNDQTRQAWAWS